MHSLRAGRLRVDRHVQPRERLVQDERALDHLREGDAVARIEVEVEVVGPIDVVAAGIPLVQVDASQVDHPEEGREVLDDREVDHVARRMLDGAGFDPVRAGEGCALHEEERARCAVRVALHDHGPIAEMGQQNGRHVDVVLDEVPLGDAERWPERLPEVRELHLAIPEVDDRLRLVAGDDADAGWQVGGRADALRSPPEGGMAVRGDPRRVATGALDHGASLARALPVDASPC